MNAALLAQVEREVLSWPDISKEPGRFASTSYRLGRREIGHLHRDGVADIPFPRAVHDELIAAGRARPHRAGFPTIISFYIERPEDVPSAIALFRMSYDRLTAADDRVS
jgi:Family of unknown function (DUF5519)